MLSNATYINIPCGHTDFDILKNCCKCGWYNDDVVLVNEATLSNINKVKCSACADNNHENPAVIMNMPCQCMNFCLLCSIDSESTICTCGESIEYVVGWNENIYR